MRGFVNAFFRAATLRRCARACRSCRARYRELAAALRADPGALAGALRERRSHGGFHVRRPLRPNLAVVLGGLGGGLSCRLTAAIPGGVRRAKMRSHSLDARLPLRLLPGSRMDTCDVLIVGGGPAGS